MTWTEPHWKPSATARKKAALKTRGEAKATEATNKRAAKKRDGYKCRFPLCGCAKLKLRIESSHDLHKGMGGNPAGDRSETAGLITLCLHRHQHGAISRHAGTLRARHLSPERGNDGPVYWDVDAVVLERYAIRVPIGNCISEGDGRLWVNVAREASPGCYSYLNFPILERLAEMDL